MLLDLLFQKTPASIDISLLKITENTETTGCKNSTT